MREVRAWLVIACAMLAGCRQHGEKAAKEGPSSDLQEGEIAITLGDCAPVTTPFVSGPEPQSFTDDALKAPATTLFATMTDGGDVSASFNEGNGAFASIGELGPGTGSGGGTGLATIGHGAGTGYGISSYAPRDRTNLPQLLLGQPSTKQTGLEPAVLRRYIKRDVQRLAYCYEKSLLKNDKLAGVVRVQLAITAEGSVSGSNATGVSPDVDQCVAETVARIEFPKPKDGHPMLVGIGLSYAPNAKKGPLEDPPLVDPPATADLPHHPPPQPTAAAFAHVSGPGVIGVLPAHLSRSYLPGTASPLQTLRIALLDCFRRQDKRYATAVFDLGPGTLVAHGIEGAAFEKCIADLASQVKATAPTRCAVAFGSAPASSLPSIDITADAITMNGKKTSEVAAILAGEPDPWWKIESVHTAAGLRVRSTLASKEPLTLQGPLVVRPLPTTPMKVVTKLVYTLVDAGDDPVLAAQRNGQWVLLRERPLPIVPVPLGTGGSWSSDKDRVRAARSADDAERPNLSVLVSSKDIWVGVSKGGTGARFADKDLAAELTKQQASAPFVDRGDIEIAATDDVPYSRVVEVIDRARAAGFTEWSLMAQRGLSAPPPVP